MHSQGIGGKESIQGGRKLPPAMPHLRKLQLVFESNANSRSPGVQMVHYAELVLDAQFTAITLCWWRLWTGIGS